MSRFIQARLQLLFVCLWANWSRQVLFHDWIWCQSWHYPYGLLGNLSEDQEVLEEGGERVLDNFVNVGDLQLKSAGLVCVDQ